MNKSNRKGAITYALAQLKNKLSSKLTYHSLRHTQNDVLPGSIRLARQSDVSPVELDLVMVAAAFHDIGFTQGTADHEMVGCRIVTEVLPQFGFSSRQIEQVVGMIMATRLPQSPRNLLEAIIADADLSLLGRPDFLAYNLCLRQELANYGQPMDSQLWYESQLAFLQNHAYFTAVAQALYNEQKQQNIDKITKILSSLGA